MNISLKFFAYACLISFTFFASPIFIFARGGGGGSGGGGGDSGGGSSSYSGSSGSTQPMYQHGSCSSSIQNQTEEDCLHGQRVGNIFTIAVFVFFATFIPLFFYLNNKKRKEKQEPVLSKKTEEIYFQFQKAWSEFDIATLEKITSARFYKQLVLELAVLKNEHREDRMTNVKLLSNYVDKTKYQSSETLNMYKAEVSGKANDILYDTELQEELYADNSSFTEYWTFVMENDNWKLDIIDQATANYSSINNSIVDFATKNNFFYNPDFGWLMIPNKGDLFSEASFKTSDVNNHVIGVYKNKIVEFYSIIFKRGGEEYFIGQAILPKTYNRIVIRRKNKFSLFERGGVWS